MSMIAITCLALIGCQDENFFYLPTTEVAKVSYTSFLSNCSNIYDVNISDAWGICGTKHNVLTTLYAPDNWSVSCCDYLPNRCTNEVQTNFSGLCSYNYANSSSFSWEYRDMQWIGLCCDLVTGLCYEQLEADITLNNSCQTNYTMVTSTIFQNATSWDAWCCVSGGLQ